MFHVVRFLLLSRKRLHVQWISIYRRTHLEAAGYIGCFDSRSVPFSMDKTAKNGTYNVFYVRFSTFIRMEIGTDWKLK